MRTALLSVLALLSAACDPAPPLPPASEPVRRPLSLLGEPEVASVSGYAFDPEAFHFWHASCAGDCPPPLVVSGMPGLESALIAGASVSLADPIGPRSHAAPTTASGGTWELDRVKLRRSPPLFTHAVAEPSFTGAPLAHRGPPPTAVPPANYLPTISLRPISTLAGTCASISAPLLSDAGPVDALARLLSREGEGVTPGALIDPARQLAGGVAVVWLHAPRGPKLREPADGTSLEASVGAVYPLGWAPPGGPLPEGVDAALQSPRGYFVLEAQSVSPLGLFVVLLPPGPPQDLVLTPLDASPDAASRGGQGPWKFPPLPPQWLAPGVVSYLEPSAIVPRSPKPPRWLCLP